MGITNLCQLLNRFQEPSDHPDAFDAILIDAQSYLYAGIDQAVDEDFLTAEICRYVWSQIVNLLNTLTSHDTTTVVISFDGVGVPMKWPTQRQRRNKTSVETNKALYKFALFGANTITLQVQQFLIQRLRDYMAERPLHVVLCGCQVVGEGEHKIFQAAEKLECRRPIIVSVDQDVFILALLRLHRYDSLQIFRYKKFYKMTALPSSFLPVSTLFGNDFIPPIVGITPNNAPCIQEHLYLNDSEDPPSILAEFLQNMLPKLKYTEVHYINPDLIQSFWMIYLWILDYYTQRTFPQLYMENTLYDIYDRNQLIVALKDKDYSKKFYHKAQKAYRELETEPILCQQDRVFIDSALLQQLASFWITQSKQTSSCTVLKSTYT